MVTLAPSELSFLNPMRFKAAIFGVEVQNFGTVRDGPALLSVQVERLNPNCGGALAIPFFPHRLTLDPGDHAVRRWVVLFASCSNPTPLRDYRVTARVSAPGDTNPGNDSLTATVDVLKRDDR